MLHYLELRSHRQWTNPLHYLSHLQVTEAKRRPSLEQLDRLLNNKWMEIQRSKIVDQFNEIHQQEIQTRFVQQVNGKDEEIQAKSREFQEDQSTMFHRWMDRMLVTYEQIGADEHRRYQSCLTLLREEFEKEKRMLDELFVQRELKELNDQIRVLDAIGQEDVVQQLSIFHRRLTEISAQQQLVTEVKVKRTTLPVVSSRLLRRTRLSEERIGAEIRSIAVIRNQIRQTRKEIRRLDLHRRDAKEKVHSVAALSTRPARLCLLAHDSQELCGKKLRKAERILRLAEQCRRHELPECWNTTNEEDEPLALLWRRIAGVQIDVNRLLRERDSRRGEFTRLIGEERRRSGFEKSTNALNQTGVAGAQRVGEGF